MDLSFNNIDYSFESLWEYDGFLMGVDQEKQTILYWNNNHHNKKYDEYSLITIPDINILNLFLSNRLPSIDLFSIKSINQIGLTYEGEVFKTTFKTTLPSTNSTLGFDFFNTDN